MSIEVSYLITLVFGIAGFVSVIYNLANFKKQEAKQDANIAFELKALKDSLAEFKVEIKLSIDSNGEMALENHDDIIKLKGDMKTAFIRIDELKEAVRRP